ncbi:ATP-binding cassette domain-containing protein [Leptolyngbya sp. FACHB-261]|uniref:ABC transporter ATP-binding protein n=1 Tax=Leptolyngbya sp. FACHB-261 TaxID=2692806 RepID=UPI001687A8EF|nr:ATP-binding cassette domain-containing protein [Leptolyngbya sp. FACHB-261]MBD2100828.1 ATP-binding cassette domain-containing protein [Leptolyngbya sp. FACHB-261]
MLLRLEQVGRQVRDGATGNSVWLLRDLSFGLQAGECLSIVGPSGSGKTSLLRLLMRLEDPTHGQIFLEDKPLTDWPVQTVRQRLSLVFQEGRLFTGSVRDNLLYGLQLRGWSGAKLDLQLNESAALAGIPAEWLERPVEQLSRGQQQQVAIARALCVEPEILLLDEPTANLDTAKAVQLIDALVGLSLRHTMTVVLTTHQREWVSRLDGRALALQAGQLVWQGPAVDLPSNL